MEKTSRLLAAALVSAMALSACAGRSHPPLASTTPTPGPGGGSAHTSYYNSHYSSGGGFIGNIYRSSMRGGGFGTYGGGRSGG